MMKRTLLIGLCLWLASCAQTNEVVEQVSLSVENLPPLEGAFYQLWVTFYQFNKPSGGDSPEHEGEYVSIGTFKVAPDGSLRSLSGGAANLQLPAGTNAQLLKDLVVSVQTQTTAQPQSIIMGGAFHGDAVIAVAELSIAYSDAFRSDFSPVTGACTIVAPTSPPDSNSGVWFVELGSTVTAGLRNLPSLPTGWRYEGWVLQATAGGGVSALSTGKFSRADSADLDGAGPYAGTGGPPFNFPGQDFVRGASVIPDLRTGDYRFMVTIEPHPDNAARPFFLTLLTSAPATPSQSRTIAMTNVIGTAAPKGKVVVRR